MQNGHPVHHEQTLHSVIARGCHTAYIDTNPDAPSNTPIVICLHGLATSNFMYRNVIDDLAFNARIIAPDLPGFGHSQKHCSWNLNLDSYTLWLEEFIDQVIGLDQRFHLILHDIGGPIGLSWSVQHKNRIKSLLLLNTSIYVEHFRPPLIAIAGALPQVGNKIIDWTMQGERLKRIWQHEFSSPVCSEDIGHYCAPYEDPNAREALTNVLHQFPSAVSHLHHLRSELKRLQTPCSILFGSSDSYCKPANATVLAQAIDGAHLRFIQGVGHFVAEDAPYVVSEEMRELLKKSGEHISPLASVTHLNAHRKQLAS
ncbi:hypothetical protein A9Q99_10670 [Gammaproteobacteria bacterium 45_16_T64]|nr:hypothetical protein A9Q99_10670 [Gammaproteobacteria bacterium 45_16_T64]